MSVEDGGGVMRREVSGEFAVLQGLQHQVRGFWLRLGCGYGGRRGAEGRV